VDGNYCGQNGVTVTKTLPEIFYNTCVPLDTFDNRQVDQKKRTTISRVQHRIVLKHRVPQDHCVICTQIFHRQV